MLCISICNSDDDDVIQSRREQHGALLVQLYNGQNCMLAGNGFNSFIELQDNSKLIIIVCVILLFIQYFLALSKKCMHYCLCQIVKHCLSDVPHAYNI